MVGLYCFSRLCINLALRIHVSEATADLLRKLGGYHLESRGTREIKVGISTTATFLPNHPHRQRTTSVILIIIATTKRGSYNADVIGQGDDEYVLADGQGRLDTPDAHSRHGRISRGARLQIDPTSVSSVLVLILAQALFVFVLSLFLLWSELSDPYA